MSNSIETMKAVVTVFNGGISPHVDIADSLWIYDIDKDRKIVSLQEKCSAEACEHPLQLKLMIHPRQWKNSEAGTQAPPLLRKR